MSSDFQLAERVAKSALDGLEAASSSVETSVLGKRVRIIQGRHKGRTGSIRDIHINRSKDSYLYIRVGIDKLKGSGDLDDWNGSHMPLSWVEEL